MSILGWLSGIGIWLVLGWIVFAIFEARGMRHKDRAGIYTLSFAVYTIGEKWPLSIFLLGLGVGFFWGTLGTHFFWHFCPPGSVSTGFLVPSYHVVLYP